MKRILTAFALSYLATLLVLAAITYANREGGQLVGRVLVSQELAVPDYHAGEYGNAESGLPFFWIEIGQSKAIYRAVRQRSEFLPYFYLTTQPQHDRFKKGLFVEVYDYDWSFQGKTFNQKLMNFFPVARDEIIKGLQSRGIAATPKGEIVIKEERSRTSLLVLTLGSFLFVPSFLITVLMAQKKRANQSPLRTPIGGTPTAGAPVAPPSGAAGL